MLTIDLFCYFANFKNMTDVFQALAHPARRRIVALLRERARTAGEIAAEFDIAKPTLSGHFNVLKAAGLITVERRGASLLYAANLSVLEEAMSGLMDMFRLDHLSAFEPRRENDA
jgi:DNA-binding transcriptional ArsR family regulator